MALTTHELRSPLNAIIGYLELLDMELTDKMNPKQKDYFMRVRRASKHLLGVTNDFLDMAQGDAGRLQVDRKVSAARDTMGEAAALVVPQAAAREVTILLSETVEGIAYVGDDARVRQILVNLLGNAVSFTPRGGTVRVTASRTTRPAFREGHDGADCGWCVVSVVDDGPGIPSDKLGAVFEPFVQLTAGGQVSRQGSGLGLTVSRQLALLMGGELTVASNGAGTEFTLWMLDASAHRENGAVLDTAAT